MNDNFEFYDQSALLYRLSDAIADRPQEVVFLLGSPLSAPCLPSGPGVPDVAEVINLIRTEFSGNDEQLRQLDSSLLASPNKYQTAFKFLLGRKGQDVANEIIQKAVLSARVDQGSYNSTGWKALSDEQCRALEADHDAWHLGPGLKAVGTLISRYPDAFGGMILTTNFDPCIQQSIFRAGGQSFRTTLHGDASLNQTAATGCHVIHLHGYWWGSDTLHTSRQLTQARPRLTASLNDLLKHKLLVVCGYGGWDDVFTKALFDVVHDDLAAPEVLWLFHGHEPSIQPSLQNQLRAGIDRARVSLYSDIDCNNFLPSLLEAWERSPAPAAVQATSRSNPVSVPIELQATINDQLDRARQVEGDSEDRPPQFSVCVGREDELELLSTSLANVVFVTGIGGQGKSTIAAQFYESYRVTHPDRLLVWRDCKEVGETFENQIVSVIENLTRGRLSASALVHQTTESLIDILVGLIVKSPVLFVFDNVDNYVSLDRNVLTSSANLLVRKFLETPSDSQILFTCRPTIDYRHSDCLSLHLQGLDLEATRKLFIARNAQTTDEEIKKAHEFTDGHSLWLDLLAIQTKKLNYPGCLNKLLNEIGEIPENTLVNIWQRLREAERLVLQVLAETVKPSSDNEVADYLQDRVNFNKLTKAINALRAQNLVVVKEMSDRSRVLELHPVVRQFVRTRFPIQERQSFMEAIIAVYRRTTNRYARALAERPSFVILQNWTQQAELNISAGHVDEACITLAQASKAFSATAFSREYTKTVRMLLSSCDWVTEHRSLQRFDEVFEAHIESLSYLGEISEVDDLLEQFALTVIERDSRYIKYCEIKCFAKWVRKDFVGAIQWGKIGVTLLDKTGVDVQTEIKHRLALAQRDAGNPEVAIEFFLRGRSLADVLDPEELDEARGGAHYGNIGRCLHFMGQINSALACYQKSALLLEKEGGYEQILNQGYIRWWVGELLLARNQKRLASIFVEAAKRKWELAAPELCRQLGELQKNLNGVLRTLEDNEQELESVCRRWILGEWLDEAGSSEPTG